MFEGFSNELWPFHEYFCPLYSSVTTGWISANLMVEGFSMELWMFSSTLCNSVYRIDFSQTSWEVLELSKAVHIMMWLWWKDL